MNDKLTVFNEQGEKLLLGPNEHLATGGEGAVYARGSLVHKVYLDPVKARKARLAEKFELLRKLKHPGVAAPVGMLTDKQGAFVGMSFERVQGEALCKLYTNSWRDAHQVGADESCEVTLRMRDIMCYAHSEGAVLVDANELNWLVDGVKPTVIDVDSWQLPGFAATAIMPSIRDPQAVQQFNPGSDWYAWAIVTFQLWTGIHPFKGTHPDFPRNALEARMKANVSIFDSKVKVPAAARSVNDIPPALRAWYEEVFQLGARSTPPANLSGAVALRTAPRLRVQQLLNALLKQERLGNAGGKILAAFQGYAVVKTSHGLKLWDALRKAEKSGVTAQDCAVILNRKAAVLRLAQGDVLLSLTTEQTIELRHVDRAQVSSSLPSRARKLWQSGSRVFALVDFVANGLVELSALQMGSNSALSIAAQWPVSTLSTEFFRGCFVQDCLGSPFLGVLEGEGLVQLKAPALRAYRVIDGLGLDRHNVWLTALRRLDGQTVRIQMNAGLDEFVVAEEELVAQPDLDGAVLASGVGVIRLGDDLRVSKGTQTKVLASCGLPSSARLFSMGSSLGLFEDSEVSRLSLG